MQSVGKNMTRGNPLKLILALSLPLMVANAFQQLYTVADTAIVGSVLGLGRWRRWARWTGSTG